MASEENVCGMWKGCSGVLLRAIVKEGLAWLGSPSHGLGAVWNWSLRTTDDKDVSSTY